MARLLAPHHPLADPSFRSVYPLDYYVFEMEILLLFFRFFFLLGFPFSIKEKCVPLDKRVTRNFSNSTFETRWEGKDSIVILLG